MEQNIITDYIIKQNKESQQHLWDIYKLLNELLGERTEKTLSYQMPTFKAKRNVIHFAAFKNHVGIYPGAQAIKHFENEFSGYNFSKGTLQIKHNQKLPNQLIAKLALYSYELNK